MSDEWDFYICKVNGVPSSIFVDIGARATAPDPARPHLLWVWIPLLYPSPDGLSTSQEAAALNGIEDYLAQLLQRDRNAVFVGRITGAARRELYFYASDTEGFSESVKTVRERFPPYEAESGDVLDASWNQYLNVLYPGPRDFERMRNRRVVDALKAEGDTLSIPRPVTHWIYFQTAGQLATAAARLSAQGFDVEETSSDGLSPSPSECGLRIERVAAVDQDSIDREVLGILDLMGDLDYDYDGWECPVTKPADERGLLRRLFRPAT